MAEKKMIRKVISGKPSEEKASKEEVSKEEVSKGDEVSKVSKTEDTGRLKKVCSFCQSKTSPSYTDTVALRRFTSDRVKILPRAKSGICSKHQRVVTRQIKYARHLALLPFVPKV